MSSRNVEEYKWKMMELPDGITTSNGSWYHINSIKIEEYVPGLLKERSLKKIIKEADAWVKSADGLALLLYFILVYVSVAPLLSATIAITFFVIWYLNTSVFVFIVASPIMKLVTNDGFIYMMSAVLLIGIAMQDSIFIFDSLDISLHAVWYGIILFFLFKVGLMRLFMRFISNRKPTQKIEMEDRILNMLLIRYGMKYGILTGKVDEMQNRLIDIANYHKTRKSTKKKGK